RRHTRWPRDWSSDVCSSDLESLLKAITLIRARGLRHRMEEPALFIRRMNILCMQMAHTWTESDSKRQRKKALRKMDKLVGSVAQIGRASCRERVRISACGRA